jgi:hypothetical protein
MNQNPISPRLVGRVATICGISVLVVEAGDKVVAVDVDSVLEAVPGNSGVEAWLRAQKYAATVYVDGMPRTTYLVPVEPFFMFCMMHPSPRLDQFREGLARICRTIQDRGSYIDRNAGPAEPGVAQNGVDRRIDS